MSGRFLPSYSADRDEFRALARQCGGDLEAHAIAARGPSGEQLTVDVARFGANQARRLFVVGSGVHGVEGPAGSAIQRELLANLLRRLPLPADGAVLLVHGLNPYGYAWSRRQNEDNVDINRNFLDFAAPGALPARPDYASIDWLINPSQFGEPREFLRTLGKLSRDHGRAWVHRTLIEGQYEFPRGLYYGGCGPVESNRLVRALFARHCAGIERHAWLARHFAGQRLVVPTTDDSSPAVPLAGKLTHALRAAHPAMEFMTVEFGTVDDNAMIVAEWQENWLHHFGDRASAQGAEILRAIRETSCPNDAGWQARVLAQGIGVLLDGWRAVFGDR